MTIIKDLWQNTKITPFFKWFDLWIGIFIEYPYLQIYICPLPTIGIKISFIECDWFDRWYYGIEEEDGTQYHWLCNCGHYEESGLHCSYCGSEPPWGCDCSFCDEKHRGYDDEEYDFDYEEYYREQ